LESIAAAPADVPAGGPDIMTRREIVETAFQVVGKRSRIVSVPASVIRLGARITSIINRRKADLLEFAAAVSTCGGVAPQAGRLRLIDYFRELAASAK
jgi:hypothetical protein